MKKNIFYILIIIILVGFFSPIVKVGAQSICSQATPSDPSATTGTCTTPGNPTPNTQSTKGTCGSPSTFIPDTYGVCTKPDGSVNPCWTQTSCAQNNGTFAAYYNLLAPLPGIGPIFNPISAPGVQNNNLGIYLNAMITIFIGLCAVLAVVMIVIGGMEYMTSELISSKEEGRDRILHAIFGLLLALGAWTILNQINPTILNTNLSSLQNVTVDVAIVSPESSAPFVPINSTLQSSVTGINCPGGGNLVTNATSFVGNSTYSQTNRNTVSGGKAVVDCSSFIDQAYSCTGLTPPGNNTTAIFSSGATAIKSTDISVNGTQASVNGVPLQVGDLLGWTAGQGGQSSGHVVMYIGNGQIIDAMGGTVNGVTTRALSANMISMITYFKPHP